jgi:hypothetical protein
LPQAARNEASRFLRYRVEGVAARRQGIVVDRMMARAWEQSLEISMGCGGSLFSFPSFAAAFSLMGIRLGRESEAM